MSVRTEADLWAMAAAEPLLGGRCGHCERYVDNTEPNHRVTPIAEGGRGVECALRGDLPYGIIKRP